MRVLVTGGTGFLGRAVVKTLSAHGHDVVICSHSVDSPAFQQFPVVRADVRERAWLASVVDSVKPEAVCHLAALTSVRESFADPIRYFDVNACGTMNLLASLAPGIKFVMTSTNAVYGTRVTGRLSEDLPPNPENPYAASKLAAEQVVNFTAKTGAIGSIILRCFNISGAVDCYMDPDQTRIITNILRAAAGDIEGVSVNGDGTAVREFTHVLDVATAIRLALEATEIGKCRTYNVGTGIGITMMDLIYAGERISGKQIKVIHRPAAPEAHTLIADPTLVTNELRWRPEQSSIDQIMSDAWNAKAALSG